LNKNDIESRIVDFLKDRFELPFGEDIELSYDTHLYDLGYIDSMDSLVLITFLEKTFKIEITTQELIDSSINTVNEMVEFISVRVD